MRLVADADVLLSAVLGGSASRVLVHPRVEAVLAAASAMEEVQRNLGHPVWSNDDDFEDAGVAWYTTAELLKRLDEP